MFLNFKNKKIQVYIKWTQDEFAYDIKFGKILFSIPESRGFNIPELEHILHQDSRWVESRLNMTKEMFLVKRTRHELFLILKKYVEKYEQVMNVMIKRIRISEKPTKYEWAHNRNGYLSFSSECVELPEHIVEVLVVHEMTHMFSSYHDDLFYRKFEEFLPGARVRDDEINLYVGCSSVVEEMKVYR